MSRHDVYSQSNEAENVYFNATLLGPSSDGPVDGVAAIYDVTRTQPIISRPSDYYASIVRLTIPLNSMPIFVCPIDGPMDGINVNTPWFVGITFGGTYYTEQRVLWQTELYAAANPFVDWFYFCFSYGTFVSMINVAIAAAYAQFQADNPGAPQAIANQAPFLIYDPKTQLMSWVWHDSWATLPPAVEPLVAGQARVTLNNSLLAVFDGFRTLLRAGKGLAPNDQAHYVWEDTGDNAYTLNGFANTSFTEQGFIAITLLANLRRLIVTTSSLPIVPEAVPASVPSGGTSSSANSASTLPILTDFVPQLESSADVRSLVFYVPTAQYRLANLISDTPLYRVQLSFFWQAADGRLVPIIIARNQQVDVKLGFFKKSLYAKLGLMPQ